MVRVRVMVMVRVMVIVRVMVMVMCLLACSLACSKLSSLSCRAMFCSCARVAFALEASSWVGCGFGFGSLVDCIMCVCLYACVHSHVCVQMCMCCAPPPSHTHNIRCIICMSVKMHQ